MALSQSILPEFDHEAGNTRKMLERCPTDKFGWKPHKKSWTLGDLVSHVCNLPMWAVATIQQDSLDLHPADGKAPESEVITSSGHAIEAFDRNNGAARDAIESANDELLFKKWTLLAGGKEIFSMPKVAVLRGFVFNHLIHHRGQLSVYLRLLDVPLPAIYGPSADEQGM